MVKKPFYYIMIPSVSTTSSFPLILEHPRKESPVSIDIFTDNTLQLCTLSPLRQFFLTQQTAEQIARFISVKYIASNHFIETITSTHLEDEKIFKTPLLTILTELESKKAHHTEKNVLYIFHFKLVEDSLSSPSQKQLIKEIQDFLDSPRRANPFFRTNPHSRSSFPFWGCPIPKSPSISLLTADLPFEISLKKIEDCLDLLTRTRHSLLDKLHQSKPFIYDAASIPTSAVASTAFLKAAPSTTAGAASASAEKTMFSESEKPTPPFAVTKELKDFGTDRLITENPNKKRAYDTLVALSKQIAKSDFAPLSYPVFETRPIIAAGAASGGAGTDLISTKKSSLKKLQQKNFPTSYPLLNLDPDECAAIFGSNVPDIARSMLNGVFKSENPNQASLIRTELFMNFLANNATCYHELHSILSEALEEAILDLNDYEKAWARAKFISIAFLKVFGQMGSSLPYAKPTKIHEHFIKMDTKEAPLIESTDGKTKPITRDLYKKALQKITFHLNALSIIKPFIESILKKEDLNWEKRKHLISSYYQSRR